MIWKKTWFSYGLWTFYSGIVCIALALGIFLCFPKEKLYIMLGMVCLFFLLLTGLYYLIQFLVKKAGTGREFSKKTGLFFEVFLLAAACIGGSILRIVPILQADLTALAQTELLQNSFVTDGMALPQTAHGQEWFFMHALRALFLFTGNHANAALWLQFAMQMLGSFFFYLGIRKLSGKAAAIAGFTGMMFLPVYVQSSSVLNAVWMEFLLFGFGFYLTGSFLRARRNEEEKERTHFQKAFFYIGAILLGLYIAVVIYGDVSGVLLVLLGGSVLWSLPVREKKDKRYSLRTVLALCLLLGAVGGITLLFAWKAYANQVLFLTVAKDWFAVYRAYLSKPVGVDLYAGREVVYLILTAVSFFGIFGFFKERKEESLSGMFLFFIGTAVLYMQGLFRWGMEAFDMRLLLLMTVCASFAVGTCFRFVPAKEQPKEKELEKEEQRLEQKSEPKLEQESKIKTQKENEEKAAEVCRLEEAHSKVKLLENPLPGPKKHISKTMDYDIEVADDDDYDI